MICAVKNDLPKVKIQLEHHKAFGINNFVYIDNISDDGTFVWLSKQKVDIYRTEDKFHSTVKESWIRQIKDIYGYNRWYLILDSDELFVYPDMENKQIQKMIHFAEREYMFFVQSSLIDMHPKEKIFKEYIKIINKNLNLYFYNHKSQKFNTSMGLLKINIFDVYIC